MFTHKEINNRKPLWSAFSQLWLDTELQDSDLNSIAEIMFNSGYSIEKLHDIYAKEVAPVVYTNLLGPAGVWSGFDDDWLYEKIIASLKSRSRLDNFFFMLKRRAMFYATECHWKDLELRVIEMKRNHDQTK